MFLVDAMRRESVTFPARWRRDSANLPVPTKVLARLRKVDRG